MSIMKLS